MCVITAFKYPDGVIGLTKTRDRVYHPKLKFCHSELDGVRFGFYLDVETSWLEGINEHGIAIVNSALMVTRDEKEHKKRRKGARPAKDSKFMYRALSKPSLDATLDQLMDNPVHGHTLVTDGTRVFHIESTSRVPAVLTELDPDGAHAYTNHGCVYPEEGYPFEKDDGKSSRVRRQCALNLLGENPETGEAFLKAMASFNINGDRKHPFNMVRDTEKMQTSSLAFFHPTSRKISKLPIRGKIEISGNTYIKGTNPAVSFELITPDHRED